MFKLEWFEEAKKDYDKLEGSQKIQVNKGLQKISERGMSAGKRLEKREVDLSMCREIKLKRLGLRIIFRESSKGIEIIEIIVVGKRSDNEVFRIAKERLR
ncbi:addiction module toxin RelE [Fundicoccus culcitae]|uniref:Addiction module toxin RelE n=1 Tax=Fundicoccus culcitae TaxID=2969821 RepID=A0ABY5P245_9LACT|nr:addiction module toxin RelE [Fundicoccus culcitae]UUX32781.1 addiction module toxin RelE [Fundicoccus culcitae]